MTGRVLLRLVLTPVAFVTVSTVAVLTVLLIVLVGSSSIAEEWSEFVIKNARGALR